MPLEKLHKDQRKWTPKLVSYTLVSQLITVGILGGGGYLFVLWMDTTTKNIDGVHKDMTVLMSTLAERHTAAEVWRTATRDRLDFIDARVNKLERLSEKQEVKNNGHLFDSSMVQKSELAPSYN